MTELVLSNATTFFSGSLEKLFKTAKKYGFRYVEIVPYRWTAPAEVRRLVIKYQVQVAGVLLPVVWQSVFKAIESTPVIEEKIAYPIVQFYLGNAVDSPAVAIAQEFSEQRPYFVIHSNIAAEMGLEKFQNLQSQFHVVIENIPNDPQLIKNGVFDHNHFIRSRLEFPSLDIFETYRQAQPEVIHISYDNFLPAGLPNQKQQEELKQLLKIHQPRYITIETNPLVSIRKAKRLLDQIL